MRDHDATHLESDSFNNQILEKANLPGWLKVSAIAAASALAGGLAAAWYYRNTLKSLREAESNPADPDFGIQTGSADNDT